MHSSAFISYLYFKFASLIRLALKKAEVSAEKCLLKKKKPKVIMIAKKLFGF